MLAILLPKAILFRGYDVPSNMPGLNRGQRLPTHDHTLARVLTRAACGLSDAESRQRQVQNSNKSLGPRRARSRRAASVPRGALQRPHSTTVVSGARSGCATLIVMLPQASHTNLNFGRLPIWSAGLASINRSNIWAVENVLSPLVNFHDGSSHGGNEN
jgi:hypothetical protein